MDVRIDDLLVKQPFSRVEPNYFGGYSGLYTNGDMAEVIDNDLSLKTVTQADFLMEFHVSGHKINSPLYYPDKIKKDEDGKFITELVARTAFPFQSVIATKQLIHLCGNPIKFENSKLDQSEEDKQTLEEFKHAWRDKNMEVAWFESVYSEKITGDAAFVGYIDENGKMGYRVLSYLTGDTLFPIIDQYTGKMKMFARRYYVYDTENRIKKTMVDVWDNSKLYTFERYNLGMKGFVNTVKSSVGGTGYSLVSEKKHGFSSLPISYKRSNIGACWSPVQPIIENYEMAVSQLCENNKAYAFPILFMRGGDLDIMGRVDGRPFAITSTDADSDAKLLANNDASGSFELQLRILLQNIFMGSFTVTPPEVKAGDLPGVAIKLIYSPALEKAMEDAMMWNSFVDKMVQIFKEGYGIESKKSTYYKNLNVHGTIEPYVHQNVAEVVNNLFQAVSAGFISKETASTQTPYGKTDEYKRLLNQVRNELLNTETNEFEKRSVEPAQADGAGRRSPADSEN